MKSLFLIILFLGVTLASGSSEYHTFYIMRVHAIIKAPDKIEIQFKAFADRLGLIESSGDYKIVNSLGAIGKYQFLASTLKILGYDITPEAFRDNPNIFPPQMQEQALRDLIQYNQSQLKKFVSYIGQVIDGTKVTKAGLLAAAHLAGVGGVEKFLTGSHLNVKDMNGSSVQKYLNEFQNYSI